MSAQLVFISLSGLLLVVVVVPGLFVAFHLLCAMIAACSRSLCNVIDSREFFPVGKQKTKIIYRRNV